jgi:hypothetical protein
VARGEAAEGQERQGFLGAAGANRLPGCGTAMRSTAGARLWSRHYSPLSLCFISCFCRCKCPLLLESVLAPKS